MIKKNNKFKGIIHFIGIGGIGMSGIAEVMLNQGYKIQGSDITINANIKRLKEKSVKIFLKHKKSNISNVNAVVYSSAIKNNNPEIIASKKLLIPLVSRAEMLAELMRSKNSIAVAGSHGKTTTTSLIGSILEKGKKDPTIINGGIINSLSNNNRIGLGKWMVVEADESDGSFLKLPHEISIITNIDYEHLEYYKNINNLISSFEKFATNTPFYGCSIISLNDHNSKKLFKKIKTRKKITFDFKNQNADVNIISIQSKENHSFFTIQIKKNIFNNFSGIYKFRLNLLGKHNILNATAAIITGFLININYGRIYTALKNFQGVNRRFTYLGKIGNSFIYDDYAHHPTEIKATYEIAKIISKKNIIVIFQPHRFSRTKDLYYKFIKELKKIDILFISEIYSAGEKKIKNISSIKLVKDLKKISKKKIVYVKNINNIDKYISEYYIDKNIIIFMGAGSISLSAKELIEKHENKKL